MIRTFVVLTVSNYLNHQVFPQSSYWYYCLGIETDFSSPLLMIAVFFVILVLLISLFNVVLFTYTQGLSKSSLLQVASQPAMECLPLVMEPESGFYSDPVVVLDFQSLYPSMIIAYNLCFCTCLGKVVPSKTNTLGVSPFVPEQHILQDLKDQILLTPNGVMFVPSKVIQSILFSYSAVMICGQDELSLICTVQCYHTDSKRCTSPSIGRNFINQNNGKTSN